MKRLGLLLVAVMAMICFSSCGGADGAVKDLMKNIQKQEFEKAAEYIGVDKDSDRKDVAATMQMVFKGDNEIVDYKILGTQEISDDEVQVAVAVEKKGGDTPKGISIFTVKQRDGEWKVELM